MIYDVCALGEILIDAIAEADSEVHITGNAGGAVGAFAVIFPVIRL